MGIAGLYGFSKHPDIGDRKVHKLSLRLIKVGIKLLMIIPPALIFSAFYNWRQKFDPVIVMICGFALPTFIIFYSLFCGVADVYLVKLCPQIEEKNSTELV